MNVTPIEWTTFSANPLKYRDPDGNVVHACVHESPGCKNCYAEALAGRWGRKGGKFNVQTTTQLTPFLDENELHKMRTAKTIGGVAVSGSKCFIGDMTDIFGDWVSDALLVNLFAEMALRPDVTFQVLTKRAKRMHELIRYFAPVSGPPPFSQRVLSAASRRAGREIEELPWPLPNVWLGVSVENQEYADARIPHLLQTPAAIRFISAEPLLGPVDLLRTPKHGGHHDWLTGEKQSTHEKTTTPHLDWVIVGGESGPKARPFDLAWARSIVKQCKDAGVACFVKQLGAVPAQTCSNCGRTASRGVVGGFVDACGPSHAQLIGEIQAVRDNKGGDITEWPTDLQVREMPRVSA